MVGEVTTPQKVDFRNSAGLLIRLRSRKDRPFSRVKEKERGSSAPSVQGNKVGKRSPLGEVIGRVICRSNITPRAWISKLLDLGNPIANKDSVTAGLGLQPLKDQ